MERIALFPGSFDPFTRGHENLVRRGAELFDELIVGIGVNSAKKRFFEADVMTDKINEVFADLPNVRVVSYEGLTAVVAKEYNAKFILRGLRNTTDFEYENTISQANKYINDGLETVFLITEPQLAHISSTITREIYKFGGDVSPFLPYSL